MARIKFTHFVPRDKPKKRPGVHKKSLNKSEKRQKKLTRYKGGGRGNNISGWFPYWVLFLWGYLLGY